MTRYTNTWVFNIDSEIWNECLGQVNRSGDEDTTSRSNPVFGFTVDDQVSQHEFKQGDLVLARIVSEESGIAAIWKINSVVPAKESDESIVGRDFDWLVHCDVLQHEFNSVYRENWERFAEVADANVDEVSELTSRKIVNLRPDFKQTYINGLLEHDSVTKGVREQLIETRRAVTKDDPKIWIENTEIEGKTHKKEGELQLGNAVYSPCQNKQGHDCFATMRCAEVGDIVLHLLQNKGKLVGISVIESELETDYEGLPEFGWADEQKGYRRWLTDYKELNEPLDIYEDVLSDQENSDLLNQIREKYDTVFCDENCSLDQDRYFIQCIEPLANILAAQSPELYNELVARGYSPESFDRELKTASEYDSVKELTEDISVRLERTHGASNWLRDSLAEIIIRDWSKTLSKFNTEDEVATDTAVKLKQIQALYDDQISKLENKASILQSGTYLSQSPGSTLFIGLFRMLQSDAGETPNLSVDKLRAIREGQYSIEDVEPKADTRDHPLLSHLEEQIDLTIYKLTASPDYWLTAIEYRSLPVEEAHTEHWREASPGDVVIFHSQESTSDDNLDNQSDVIFGFGVLGDTYRKEEPWLRDKTTPDEFIERVISFDRMFVTSELENLDLGTSSRIKSIEQLNTEIDALTSNGLSIDRANSICLQENNTRFPIQDAFVTFRHDDNSQDMECPRAIITALTSALTELSPINYEKPFAGSIPSNAVLDGLHFPDNTGEAIIKQVEAALRAGDHIILTGPPGTGKTEIAERVATYLAANYPYLYSGSKLTTATADWSTFDTVGGYMPTETSTGDTADNLAFTPGIILNRLKNTQTGVQTNEPIIIDELNRADIDKGFGQLFTLLSGQSVQLPFTRNGREIELLTADHLDGFLDDHQYVVPNSWRIFATMNTYDKTSLYEMSYAFMRRFAFIRVPAPEFTPDDGVNALDDLRRKMDAYIAAWDGIAPTDEERDAIGLVWRETNQAVDDRSIGPAIVRDMLMYVTNRRTITNNNLSERVTEAVISYIFPQLEGVVENRQIITQIAGVDVIDTNALSTAARDMLQVTLPTDS